MIALYSQSYFLKNIYLRKMLDFFPLLNTNCKTIAYLDEKNELFVFDVMNLTLADSWYDLLKSSTMVINSKYLIACLENS